jgi:hypothetical protein
MPPGGGPPQDPAEKMAANKIDNAGATWDGVEAPTKNDIERLKEDPTPSIIKSFDAQFGQGAAEKYLGDTEDQGDQGSDEASEGDTAPA